MAPALPVYTRGEIEKLFPVMRSEEIPPNCSLYRLIQNQCTYDGNRVICLPFKRVFLRCLETRNGEVVGYRLQPKHGLKDGVYRDIEVTSRSDNTYTINDKIQDFLRADSVLQEKMQAYYERHV